MRKMLKSVLVLVAALCAGSIRATPPSGFSGTTIAMGRFGDITVKLRAFLPESARQEDDENFWASIQKTRGDSDLYVQSNVWALGGTTGWHSHPGHSLIIVTSGAVTAYEGDDPSCTPRVYTAGMGFVDPGGAHVHVLRNEGSVEARTVAVQLIPAGATRRIDAAAPFACGF
jgi:quercetin dioxygenase-like cupin family protein